MEYEEEQAKKKAKEAAVSFEPMTFWLQTFWAAVFTWLESLG